MATRIKKKTAKIVKRSLPSPFNIYWEKTNYLLFGLGLLLVIVGFYVMSLGEWDSTSSLVISPILLFVAFVIVIPASIFYRKKSDS
jgi:FtsH-binding integral membrane protein